MDATFAKSIRQDFPILATRMQGKPLVYFDNGATTQKPQSVIDAIVHYYKHDNANIHRGVYELSQRATDSYEAARGKVAQLLNADDPAESIFVRGTTEGVNLIASSWGNANLSAGDEVIVTGLEHHSNIVPWQMACDRTGAKLRIWYGNENGELDLEDLQDLLNAKTKMVAMQHVSNALGIIHPVNEVAKRVHAVGGLLLLDGAQWVGHYQTDVTNIDCDFYTFSGHKLFAPTGIGVLWGRRALLEALPPYQGGGDMIETVAFDHTTYAPLPNRFEAGTPDIAGAVGLGAAIDYIDNLGFHRIARYEDELLLYATKQLEAIDGLRLIGNTRHKAAVLSFVIEKPSIAPLDIATHLSNDGIAIRTGHHCCMPLMSQLDVSGTSRVSLAMYNLPEEVDRLVDSLNRLISDRRQKIGNSSKPIGSAGNTGATQIDPSADSASQADSLLTFAAAIANSPDDAAAELAEEFLLFDDRESKTELLMEFGQELPRDFDMLKQLTTAVPGCMSEVYLVGRPMLQASDKLEFAADSNAEVVRGLIAILTKLFSGQDSQSILQFDIEAFFRKIGLDQFVSTQRRSGLDGMIRRIHTLANTIVERKAS